MRVRALDLSGDWTFGQGSNNYLQNNAAIVQDIATRLRSVLGDCFFALSDGIDWFNLLGSFNLLGLSAAVRTTILNTQNVTKLIAVNVNLDDNSRKVTMNYTVETIYSRANQISNVVTASASFLLTQSGDFITTQDGELITI